MLPDHGRFVAALRPYQRRLRLAALADAVLWAAAMTGAVTGAAWLIEPRPAMARFVSAAMFVVTATVAAVWWRGRWTLRTVAVILETRRGVSDNVIVTAEEVASGQSRSPHAVVRQHLFHVAEQQLQQMPPPVVLPLWRRLSIATAAVAAVGTLVAMSPFAPRGVNGVDGAEARVAAPLAAGDLRVVVVPPAYARRSRAELLNPTTVVALEGSDISLEVSGAHERVALVDVRGAVVPFASDAGVRRYELQAATSEPFVVRVEDASGSSDRLVHLRVESDRRPTVRILRPAQDLMFPAPSGEVAVEIEAADDVGLSSLALRYTRVSGSGETFTFEEGEWPLAITPSAGGQWTARATFALDRLKLQDGDTLVYRAVARDAKPGGDPSASDSFLIEIGQLSGVAATGFAVPEEHDRQGLSQQMLIIKTERLHAQREALGPTAHLEQSRLLGVEQRMVKAEFVFMTGGEVADEIEEAEHAHELAEGRLENAAQLELLAAIREMSRAEARLNDGDTAGALEFERAALRALQRAFDRRRYLLRTLPERNRIDLSRRLSGERESARSSTQTARDGGDEGIADARALLRELTQHISSESAPLLASRLIAIDASSEPIQEAAIRLAAARDEAARTAAARQAASAVVDSIRKRVGITPRTGITYDPLVGRLAEELIPRPGRPQR